MQRKLIRYYDSLGGNGRLGGKYLTAVLNYLHDLDQKVKKSHVEFNVKDWTLETVGDTPRQKNAYDCGMFLLMIADFLTDDIPLSNLKQSDIAFYRQKVCLSILRGLLVNYDYC